MSPTLIEPSCSQATDAAQLKADLISRGVRYALASFVDLHGVCKAKAVPIDHLESMARGSELFTGAAFAADPLSRQVFCDAMTDAYVAFKRDEWSSYHGAVSAWETQR